MEPATVMAAVVTCPECGRRAVFTARDGSVECPNGHQWVLPGQRR